MGEILVGHVGGGEDGLGVQFGVRFGGVYRDFLVLQVGQGLDVGIG